MEEISLMLSFSFFTLNKVDDVLREEKIIIIIIIN